MTKVIQNEAQTEQYPAEPSIKCNKKYELGKELLMELRCNSYSGRGEEDVISHIAKILEMETYRGTMMEIKLISMLPKPEIKIGDEFLKILHDNSFNGMDGSDINEHIEKVLEITRRIKIPNVDMDELKLHMFSKSLSGDAKKWWDNEGAATTWKELCDKSFHNYYPLSYAYKSNIPVDLGYETDYFEFLYWLASKFNNHWKLDKNVKNRLWEFYVMVELKD
nr:hypothetical protein [Tanacetum cinerariifolium]